MINIQAINLDLIITVPLVGAALGTFIAAPVMRMFGRKKAYLAAYFLFCTPGSFLQLFAPNLGALVAGRFWNCKSHHGVLLLQHGMLKPRTDIGVSILTTAAAVYLW